MIDKKILYKYLRLNYPFIKPLNTIYFKFRWNASGCIYMLHRVGNHDGSRLLPNENMKVSPQFLDSLISKYKARGVMFISLDELFDYLTGTKTINSPFVCFTFDDGYKDNYTLAYPILKKHRVPFTIYVTTDFPDSKAFLWWYELEDLLLTRSEIKLGNDEIIKCKSYLEKCDAFMYIRRKVLDLRGKDFMRDYCKLLCIDKPQTSEYVKKLSMSWSDIVDISSDPLCTIGGHTKSHPAFNSITLKEVKSEVEEGCLILEDHIGKKIHHFAYPFGTPLEIGTREHDIIKEYGFKTVVTTDYGFINTKTNIMKLPRVFLSEKS